MKILTIALFLILSFNLFGQSEMAGHYRNHFFCEIQLNADSSFEYEWHRDLHVRWTKGTWRLKNDTIYFHIIPTYDTLTITKSNGLIADTLILSKYSIARRIAPQQVAEVTQVSVEQIGVWLPDKLVFKENKLYEVENGKLVTEKRRVNKIGSESEPWYFKSDE